VLEISFQNSFDITKIDFRDEARAKKLLDAINTEKIPELDEIIKGTSIESDIKNVLYPIIDQNQVVIVGGAFFGDEGKGKTVDAIAWHPSIELIGRTNSGPNAGHTVWFNDKKYVFHLSPSGLFTGKTNFIGSDCVMDTTSFMKDEMQIIIDDKIDYSNLFVGNVNLILPQHKIIDALGDANSSTLQGISPSHMSKISKKSFRLYDLFNSEDIQAKRIQPGLDFYHALIDFKKKDEKELLNVFHELNEKVSGRIPDHVLDFLKTNRKDRIEYVIQTHKDWVVNNPQFPKITDTEQLVKVTLAKGGKVLLEGPQSYNLSSKVKNNYRSATSPDTSASGIAAAIDYNITKHKTAVINIHKTPGSSRVGIGANPAGFISQDYFSSRNIETLLEMRGICEDYDTIQRQFFESIGENGILQQTIYKDKDGKQYPIGAAMAISSAKTFDEQGATTKKPRITGLFDCVLHHQVNMAQGPYLSISAVDRADTQEEVGIIVGYVVSNKDQKPIFSGGEYYEHDRIIKAGDVVPSEDVLAHCQPIIKKLPGWKDSPIAAKKKDPNAPLHENLLNFIGEIEKYTGAEIISIGNGPEKENLIYIKK